MERVPRSDAPAIHVVLRKEDLDPARITDKTVVVVDILFATTAIIAALDCGAAVVYPAMDADEARGLAARSGSASPVLAGETMFRFIEGFVQPTPIALCRHLRPGDSLIYSTTNGTVALRAAAGARRVLAGALINAGATARAIDNPGKSSVIILCAGTAGAFNLEDFYGAGCLVDRLVRLWSGYRLTDSAIAARDYFRKLEAAPTLSDSLVGRLMQQWGLGQEVAFAARVDSTEVVAELRQDQVRAV